MHECKRLLRKDGSDSQLLFAAGSRQAPEAAGGSFYTQVPAADTVAEIKKLENTGDGDGDESESAANRDSDMEVDVAPIEPGASDMARCPVQEPATARGRGEATAARDSDAVLPPDAEEDVARAGFDVEGDAGDSRRARIVEFAETTTLRDDWLHRGPRLADMDMWHYARYSGAS